MARGEQSKKKKKKRSSEEGNKKKKKKAGAYDSEVTSMWALMYRDLTTREETKSLNEGVLEAPTRGRKTRSSPSGNDRPAPTGFCDKLAEKEEAGDLMTDLRKEKQQVWMQLEELAKASGTLKGVAEGADRIVLGGDGGPRFGQSEKFEAPHAPGYGAKYKTQQLFRPSLSENIGSQLSQNILLVESPENTRGLQLRMAGVTHDLVLSSIVPPEVLEESLLEKKPGPGDSEVQDRQIQQAQRWAEQQRKESPEKFLAAQSVVVHMQEQKLRQLNSRERGDAALEKLRWEELRRDHEFRVFKGLLAEKDAAAFANNGNFCARSALHWKCVENREWATRPAGHLP